MTIQRTTLYLVATAVLVTLCACSRPFQQAATPTRAELVSTATRSPTPYTVTDASSPTDIPASPANTDAPATPANTDIPASPPNVVLIVADSLRADHVTSYGYHRQTTPNLDTLIARQGVRFQNATTPSPWTCPANASILTGRTPSSLGATWETIKETVPAKANTLAEYLQQAGYYTAGFVNTYCLKGKLGFAQGFNHYDDSLSDRPGSNKARASEVNALVINWLQNTWQSQSSDTQPLFLFLYYFDPHVWYTPLPPYDTLYDTTYTGTLTGDVYQDGKDVISGKIVPSARDLEHLLALYDGEMTYWDVYLGEMVSYLQDAGVLNNALIIVTADHGEMFGEHGKWTHGNALYKEVIQIPLLMRYTGVISPGLVLETPAQNMDLTPTILDWAGLPMPEGLQGISLRPFVLKQTPPPARNTFSELDGITGSRNQFYWLAPRVDLRSIQRDGWKLIHHVGDEGSDELYLLQPFSPYETNNLLPTESGRAQELRQDLVNWFGLH
jgi:arylsulfatase A-like enzyme